MFVCYTGDDRGPVLEVIVSRTNFISSHTEKPVRVVGLSTALANARDLADWLGIKQVSAFLLKTICFFCLYVIVNNICSCNEKQYESFSMIKITICIELRYYIKSRILHQPKLSCE